MNNRKNYWKGNRIEILKAIYICGCLPYRCLRLLEGQVKLSQRKAKKLEGEGLVEIRKTKQGKTIFLKDQEDTVREYREYIPESYVEFYKENKERVRRSHYSDAKMERLQKNAEVMLLMHLSHIPTYPDEVIKEWLPGTPLNQNAILYIDRIQLKKGIEYKDSVSRERDGIKRVIGSRISGLLVSPGGNYAIYSLTNHLIEWERAGEVRMAYYLDRYLKLNWNIKEDYYEESGEEEKKTGNEVGIECILFATDMPLFAKVVMNENGNKRRRKPLINIDYAYRIMYALPTTKDGMSMLQLMKEKGWKQTMEENLLRDIPRRIRDYTIECDGYDEHEDGYILLFCTADLSKLKLFLKRAVNARQGEIFTIYCFSYQLSLLSQFVLGDIRVKSMELSQYIEMVGRKALV